MVMEAIGCLLIDPFFMARIFISQETQERYIICNFFPETEFSRYFSTAPIQNRILWHFLLNYRYFTIDFQLGATLVGTARTIRK